MSCSVPVLLLAFNRPEKTIKVLEQIRKANPEKVYAHCDGPRPHVPEDREKVEAVQDLIRTQLRDISLQTFFRTENAGLKFGVHGAISWFFEQEELGIILEDDCVPDESAFRFCEELLLKYRDDPEVMQIACCNLSLERTKDQAGSYFFSHFSFIWGWASWRRAWRRASIDLDGLAEFERKGEIRRFLRDPLAQQYLLDKFQKVQTGKFSTWDYSWFYTILKNNGLCIIPKTNLVQNVGVGESDATNTTKYSKHAEVRVQPMSFPLIHPDTRLPDPALEQQFFYATQKSRLRLRLWYLLKTLGLR